VRVCAWDPLADISVMARADLAPALREGTHSEQDPKDWWRALRAAMDDLFTRIPGARIAGISLDSTSATLLPIDSSGLPLAPARLYDDARAFDAAKHIEAVAPQNSGAHGVTSSLSKWLQWQAEGLPNNARVVHATDWLLGQLCGVYGVTDENNALKLGYDPVQRVWPAWLETLGVDRKTLPRVVAPGTRLGALHPQLCQRWKLPQATPVYAGTTDSTAAFLASGAAQPGDALTVLGSTLVVKVLSRKPVFASEYGVYSHRLHDLWLVGGASNSGGAVLRQHFSDAEIRALTPQLRPGQPTQLHYYPLPKPGERFPHNDPNLAPQLMPQPQDRAQFLQGIFEGIAQIEADAYARLAELGADPVQRIFSSGGGAQNPAWTEIRQRLLNKPLLPARRREAACGVARLATIQA
jgi:sugar (pentulose or hexulose) kinase